MHKHTMKPQLLRIKVPVSQCIEEVREYLLYSEMEGKEDKTDPWFHMYKGLGELWLKVVDEEEMSDE